MEIFEPEATGRNSVAWERKELPEKRWWQNDCNFGGFAAVYSGFTVSGKKGPFCPFLGQLIFLHFTTFYSRSAVLHASLVLFLFCVQLGGTNFQAFQRRVSVFPPKPSTFSSPMQIQGEGMPGSRSCDTLCGAKVGEVVVEEVEERCQNNETPLVVTSVSQN